MGHDTLPVEERVEENTKVTTSNSTVKPVSKKNNRVRTMTTYKVSNNFKQRKDLGGEAVNS